MRVFAQNDYLSNLATELGVNPDIVSVIVKVRWAFDLLTAWHTSKIPI